MPAPDQEPDENGEEEMEMDIDMEALQQDMPEPEEVDIEDPDREPEDVLATVGGEDIILQDLYDEFALIPVQHQQQLQHRQHRLLESMIQQKLLVQRAEELKIDESDAYKELVDEFKESPMADQLDEQEIEQSALMEALLQKEVVEKVDIPEEEMKEVFEQYQQMMPEDADFEEMKPQIKQLMLRDHVDDYIQKLYTEAEIELDEEWMEEKEAEEREAQPQMMPEGQAPEGQAPEDQAPEDQAPPEQN